MINHRITTAFAILIAAFFLTCSDQSTGYENFKGDYSLEIFLDKDEYYVGIEYQVGISQGRDLYSSFYVFSEPEGCVLADVGDTDTDSIQVYFVKPFEGKLCVAAKRPDGSKDTVKYDITVKAIPDGPVILFGFEGDTLKVFRSKPGTIQTSGNADKYVWIYDNQAPETTSTAFFIPEEIEKGTGEVTLKVFGIDSSGFAGQPDSLVLLPVDYSYVLEFRDSPDSLMTKLRMEWAVEVYRLDGSVYEGKGSYSWIITDDDDTLVDTVSSYQLRYVFDDTMAMKLEVYFEDSSNYKSAPLGYSNSVKNGPDGPAIHFDFEGDTLKVCKSNPDSIMVSGDADKYVWTFNNQEPETTSTSFFKPEEIEMGTGEIILKVFGIDSAGIAGQPDSLVLLPVDYLYTLRFKSSPDSLIARETSEWTVEVLNLDGSIFSGEGSCNWRVIDEDGDTLIDTVSTRFLKASFEDSMSISLEVSFEDPSGLVSPILTYSNTVKMHRPGVSVLPLAGNFYSHNPIKVTCLLHERFRNITYLYAELKKGNSVLYSDTVSTKGRDTITVEFETADTGSCTLFVRVKDTAGVYSNTSAVSLLIGDGRPSVSKIVITPSTIYYNKEVQFTAFATPLPGKTIEEYLWIFDDDTVRTDVDNVTHSFKDDSAKIALKVIDNNGIESKIFEVSKPIDMGEPVVESIVLSDTAWIKDTMTFKVMMSDPDDMIRYAFISWGDDKKDTVDVNFTSGILNVKHNFLDSGLYEITIVAEDTNGIISEPVGKSVMVHEGRPSVEVMAFKYYQPNWGAYHDTLETIINNDTMITPALMPPGDHGIMIKVKAYSSDMNGDVKHYSIQNILPFDTATITWSDSNVINFITSTTDGPVVLLCKDDDGLIGSDTFFIKVDIPINNLLVIVSPAMWDTVTGPFVLEWEGGIDIEDSMQTRVEIRTIYNNFQDTLVYAVDTVKNFYNYETEKCRAEIDLTKYSQVSGEYFWAEVIVWDKMRHFTSNYQTLYYKK